MSAAMYDQGDTYQMSTANSGGGGNSGSVSNLHNHRLSNGGMSTAGNLESNQQIPSYPSAVQSRQVPAGADMQSGDLNEPPSLPQLLHWSEVVYECQNIHVDDWNVAGGSDYGQLAYLMDTGRILGRLFCLYVCTNWPLTLRFASSTR